MNAAITSASTANFRQWRTPILLIRISSVLFVGLMVGHMSAYPWMSTHVAQQTTLVESMRSTPFVFLGARSTYWKLYFGWGVLIGALLLTLAAVLWLLSDVARVSPRRVGAVSGVVSASSLLGAGLSLRFFYTPPAVFFAVICALLATAAVRLARQPSP
jgi:hypothetical protein